MPGAVAETASVDCAQAIKAFLQSKGIRGKHIKLDLGVTDLPWAVIYDLQREQQISALHNKGMILGECPMQCPERGSTNISKNGHRRGKQNHICADCQRQFLDHYQPLGYADDVRQECLKMYVNGMGFRGIERVKRVHHTTVITWVRAVGKNLPDCYEPDLIPQVGELDELETFVGSKKTRFGYGQQ